MPSWSCNEAENDVGANRMSTIKRKRMVNVK